MSRSLTQPEEIDQALEDEQASGDRNTERTAAKNGSATGPARTTWDAGSYSAYRVAYMKDHEIDPK